jgi:hypothetical protein
MKVFKFLISLIIFNSCGKEDVTPLINTDIVKLESVTPASFLNRNARIIKLSIHEDQMPVRYVEIRALKQPDSSKGALILTQGGFGTSFYGSGFEQNTTIDFAYKNGLEIFEVKWLGEFGWATNVQGVGFATAVRAFTDIVRWLKVNEIKNNKKIIAHGGSGGAFQIAFGLTRFELENELDYAILAAGPPTSDLKAAIFGNSELKSYWPSGIGGFAITDLIHGWRNNGDYCINRNNTPPDFVLEILDKSSILSTKVNIDLLYSTKVFFVNTNDETNADGQGKLYFDAIQSEKEWIYLAEETAHNVAGINAGAKKIREIIAELL